jgi:putative oxidoreductase
MGRLLLRLTVGGFFFGHGMQKLAGWFGGGGLAGTGQFFEQSLGLRPGRRHATAAGVAEAGGGALLALGLATPFAAAAITSVMLTAVHRVHWKNGPWSSNGGFEYNAVLIAAALALVEAGPGPASLDALLGTELDGPGWTVAALAAGVAGAVGAHRAAGAAPSHTDDGEAQDAPAGTPGADAA